MNYLLAYDFGTGGIKASLYDEAGQCIADGFDGYPTYYPVAGFHEQEPEAWWQATISSTHKLLATLSDEVKQQIVGIGISGHSLGVVPLDKDGTLLRDRTPIWSDARAVEEAKQVFQRIPEAEWYRMTGNGFPAQLYSSFKLMWFRDHEPEMFKQIALVLGTKDYINYKLTGVCATDQSYASGSGVYDLKARAYSARLIEASGLPASIFAKIVPSTQVLGTLTPEAAQALGLPKAVKVVAGGVDNSCMSLGAGAFRDGRAYNSLGSSSWIAVSSAQPLLDDVKRSYVFDHVVPGQYVSALAIFSAGTAFNWVKGVMAKELSYKEIDAESATSPVGSNGVFFIPTLSGPKGKGGFVGLELRHARADLLRATQEGIAFGLRNVLTELKKLVEVKEPLILVGGGANAAFTRQLYADVYNIDIMRTSIGQQCAALGAAVLAGIGTGVWKDFSVMDTFVRPAERHQPDAPVAQQYAELFKQFLTVTKMMEELG
jgi:xylulokinase